ncbi:MAG: hypothetical protein RL358_1318 [Pseudomonadota bacterium]|jgi:hypothetical protein
MNEPINHAYLGAAALMKAVAHGVDLTPLGKQLLSCIGAAPDAAQADALMDLSTILQLKGDREIALSVQNEALQLKQLYHLDAPSGTTALRLLALMTAGDLMTNMPLDLLLEDSDIALDILYVAPHLPFPDTVPEHDVLFVGIGESDETRSLLLQLDGALKDWPRPILNRAEPITRLSRDCAYTLLNDLPGVVMPATARLTREQLNGIARQPSTLGNHLTECHFPLIIRPVGSHAGHGLEKLANPAQLLNYLQLMPEAMFYLSRFIDYSDADGQFRKYRIVLIADQAYAAHMGISAHWIIHYMNAGMEESLDKRMEEAHFMSEFEHGFAPRHAEALHAIYQRMQLDYLVLDCAETHDGKLLVFEVDNSAVVHTLDSAELFPYKQPQMRKVFAAFRALLFNARAAAH